jgi:hypothetical protein
MGTLGLPELIVALVLCAFWGSLGFFVFGNIFAKAGYSRWLGLLVVIPLIHLVVLIWFAFADWPVRRK